MMKKIKRGYVKLIIGLIAGVITAAAVCVALLPARPALSASLATGSASITKNDGMITQVNVKIPGNVNWSNFDNVPNATINIYFAKTKGNFFKVKTYSMSNPLDINASSGSDKFVVKAIDLTESSTFTATPSWANDAYFSAPDDGTTKTNSIDVKIVISLNDGETTITKGPMNTFEVTVTNPAASADFYATAIADAV